MKKTLKLLLASMAVLLGVLGFSASALAANGGEIMPKLRKETKYEGNIALPRARNSIPTMKLGDSRTHTFSRKQRDFDMAQIQTTATFTSVYNIWITNHADRVVTVLVMDLEGRQMGQVTTQSGESLSGNIYLEPNTPYYIGVETMVGGTTGPCEYGINEVKPASLKIGSTYNRTLKKPDEIEFVKFTTNNENAYYHLYIKNTTKAPMYEVSYMVLDSKGNYCYGNDLYGESGYDVSRASLKLDKNKTYYIAAMGFDYKGNKTNGRYAISVKRSVDKAGNTRGKAKNIKVNKTYGANIDYSGDVDWYKFTLGNYKSVKMNITTNFYDEDGNRAGAKVSIYNSKGRYIDSEYILPDEKGITYKGTFNKKGTYYLKVQGYDAELGNYKITIRNPGSVRVAKPTSFTAKKSAKTSVKLNWTKKKNVSGYQIYYSYKKGSGYSKIKTVSYKKGSYTKKNLQKGKTYYFKMRAYKKVGSLYYYSKYTTPKKVKL